MQVFATLPRLCYADVMTDRAATLSPPPLPGPNAGFERKIARSRTALALERAWPWLWLPVSVLGLFLLAGLAGIWPQLTPTWHIAALAGFGLALAASFAPLARLHWPSRAEGLARLEALSGLPHRPASSYEDSLAPTDVPQASQTLWAAHRTRLARLIGQLQPRAPQPRTEWRDPLALRALMLLLVGTLMLAAGDALSDRIASAFRFGPPPSLVATRLDAWVTPPAYTGRQPVLLSDGGKTGAGDATLSNQPIEVPEGSELLVRAAGPAHTHYTVQSALADGTAAVPLAGQAKADPAVALSEYRVILSRPQTIRVDDSGTPRAIWQFKVIQDLAPTITLTGEPKQGARGSLILDYRVTDDYGVAAAEATFALAETAQSKPLRLADGSQITALGEAPKSPLKLPKSASAKDIKGKTSVDLAGHLWAGLKVKMTMTVRDRAGHAGTAVPAAFVLPERNFRNPLARAIVEQRRKLAFSPGDYLDVRLALDALAIAPDKFPIEPASYLGLRSVYRQLTETPSTELFKSVTAQMWQLALRIESGRLSDAERALKEAEDRLQKALEEGASDAEIQKLMQDLKTAMNEFLRSLAEQGAKSPDNQANAQDGKELSSKDLEQMLKRMQDMAKSGNKEAAQQMLSQLRDLLDRLQSGKMAQKGQGGQNGQMRELLDKFGNLIGKQKKLLDDTFKSGRDRRNGDGSEEGDGQGKGKKGQGPGEGDGLGGLSQRQGDLRGELDKLLGDLKGLGGKQQDQLNGAGQSMDDAQQSLQGEDPDTAAENQGKALDQLRKGAQSMAEEMMKGQNGQALTRPGNGDRDPLGRQLSDPSNELDAGQDLLPKELDVQRSRRIIEELRRRLGENARPPSELDYLERLLK